MRGGSPIRGGEQQPCAFSWPKQSPWRFDAAALAEAVVWFQYPGVRLHQEMLEIPTRGAGFVNITRAVAEVLARSKLREGQCTVFVQHTSASLVIQENADPRVLSDLAAWMAELAPTTRDWEHDDEGPDDMPAHARSALTRTSEMLPIVNGSLGMGTWQGLYLWEHRARPHQRRLVVTLIGT